MSVCVRWKDVVQKLKEEHKKTAQTLPLWQDYTQLSDRCSLHLQKLWLQWAELSRSSPQQDTQAVLSSMEVSSGFFQQSLNMQCLFKHVHQNPGIVDFY